MLQMSRIENYRLIVVPLYKEYIQQKENTLKSIGNEIGYPFEVRWDYYAQIKQG